MAKIFFTGGGTAGHVTPNVALIEAMKGLSVECQYVGSHKGIEKQLTAGLEIPFHGIHSGKLRRYFSWQNFIDPIFILMGILQSILLCLRERPNVVFSKGGFVAVPVAFAAWLCRIPVISHESDITPGLANKLCLPFSQKLCVNFAETFDYLSARAKQRTIVTGSPLRAGLRHTDPKRGADYLGLHSELPVLLVVGGSLGARAINNVIWENIAWLVTQFQVVHLVGAGNLNLEIKAEGYHQMAFLDQEYGDVLARADYVVSRAGANSIYELLEFRKPHLLIPLTAAASRGDQLVNARIMAGRGLSLVLAEENLSPEQFKKALDALRDNTVLVDNMANLPRLNPLETITAMLQSHC